MALFNLIAVFAGAVAAQSTVLAPAHFRVLSISDVTNAFPLTLVASDATATRYMQGCPTMPPACSRALEGTSTAPIESIINSIVLDDGPASKRPCHGYPIDMIINADVEQCNDKTILLGPSTWEFHETMQLLTEDVSCSWEGEMTAADWTCMGMADGIIVTESSKSKSLFTSLEGITIPFPWPTAPGETTTYTYGAELIAEETYISAYPVVTGSGTATLDPSVTPTSNESPDAAESEGLAPSRALSSGMISNFGGAAAVLAVAVVL